jgi:hypothetical protein
MEKVNQAVGEKSDGKIDFCSKKNLLEFLLQKIRKVFVCRFAV